MKKKTTTTTINVTDVRKACQEIGDKLKDKFDETADLKAAQGAVTAYSTAISAAKAQLVYKKLTGSPSKINFLK